MSGRGEHIEAGGHVICIHGEDIPILKADMKDMRRRMFEDNGHLSIQTSLATGALKFKDIDSRLVGITVEVKSLSAHVAGLADVIRQANTLQAGVVGEGLTTEGLVREVLKKMPSTSGSGAAMWTSFAVVCVCVTVVVLKVW